MESDDKDRESDHDGRESDRNAGPEARQPVRRPGPRRNPLREFEERRRLAAPPPPLRRQAASRAGRAPAAQAAQAGRTTQPEEGTVQYQWTVHQLLMPKNRARSLLLGAASLAALAFIYVSYHSLWWVVFSTILLTLSVGTYLFPLTYILTDKSVSLRSVVLNETRAWDKFEGYGVGSDFIYVGFDQRTFRGRMQRGYTLYYRDGDEKDRILSVINQFANLPERPLILADRRRRAKRGPTAK